MCLVGVQRAKNSTDHSRSNKMTVFSYISLPLLFFMPMIHFVFFPLTYHLLIFYSNLLSLSDSVSSFIFFFLYLCCRSRNHSLLLAFIFTSSISFLLPLPPSFLSLPPFPSSFTLSPSPYPPSCLSSFLPSSPPPPSFCHLTEFILRLFLPVPLHLHFFASLPNPGLNCHSFILFLSLFPKYFHLQVCSRSFGAGRMWPSGCDGQRRSSPCGRSPAALSRWMARPCCCSLRRTSATDPPTPVHLPPLHSFLDYIKGVFQAWGKNWRHQWKVKQMSHFHWLH